MPHRVRRAFDEREEGFTLIELLVVIIIIGILAAIAIPVFLQQRSKGYDAQAKSDARNTATLEEAYNYDNNYYLPAASFTSSSVPAGLAAEGLNVSPGVSGIVVAAYTNAKVAVTTVPATGAIGGYCIQVTSQSTKVFWYDSFQGGFVTFNCITSTP
jgi:type IV pilus assembly protein PilA